MTKCRHPKRLWRLSADRRNVYCADCLVTVAWVSPLPSDYIREAETETRPCVHCGEQLSDHSPEGDCYPVVPLPASEAETEPPLSPEDYERAKSDLPEKIAPVSASEPGLRVPGYATGGNVPLPPASEPAGETGE